MSVLATASIKHIASTSNNIVLTSTGRVGIGTESPSTPLHIVGEVTLASQVRLGAGSASTPAISASGDTNTGMFFPTADTIAFAEGGTEVLRITSDARVGIGTSSPGALLDIAGNIIVRGGGAEGGDIGILNPDGASIGGTLDVSSADVTRWFTTRNNSLHQIGQLVGTGGIITLHTAANERMRITAAGDVGIGTTTPSFGSGSGVDIERAGISTLRLDDTADGTAIEIKAAVGAVAIDGRTNHPMLFATNGIERMRLDNSGNLGIGTTSPASRLEVNGGLRASVTNAVGGATSFVVTRLDGSSSALAAPSAAYLQQVCGLTTNGVYWINLPTAGPTQVFCILDPACAGGGWMMAIKGTRGTTFPYTSSHWTTTSTVNPTETNRNDGDAKFHTYNYFPARDWLAIWPDLSNGGDVSGGYTGWTWVELEATGTSESVLTYMNRGVQITKASNGIVYSATNPGPTGLPKYGNLWSMSGGFQWYGLNYTGNTGTRVRWGWATNNENEQASNDINGGIGMTYSSFSAGDIIGCCQVITGINRSARFEWYVR